MSKLYEELKNMILKPVLYTGLVAMTLTGCDTPQPPKIFQTAEARKEEVKKEKTYFDNWGFVDEIRNYTEDPLDIELGDFDGDGDLDIAIATNLGGLRIYENRIPR